MKFKLFASVALFATTIALMSPKAHAQKVGLDIYFIDTEGGAATLIVSADKVATLIDCGSPGERDAARIYHVAHNIAHLNAIDNLIITHWHSDHYGGTAPLNKLLPIRHFYNKGIPDKTLDDPENFPTLIAAYKAASGGNSVTVHTGDDLSLAGSKAAHPLQLKCLIANQVTAADDTDPTKKNGFARLHKPAPLDPSDNANSLGFLLSYSYFRFLDLGDLTWNLEYKLISPNDKIGLIDVYQTTHHGIDQSNNPALIKTVRPIVAVINNGPHKGGTAQLFTNLLDTGSVAAIYEQHRYLDAKPPTATELAEKKLFVANLDENCKAEFIHIQVNEPGDAYTVGIGEHGHMDKYACRFAPQHVPASK